MSISTNYGSGLYDSSFYDLTRHDISEIERKGGVAKLDTLSDLRLSGDKLIKSEDAVKLMEKYDSDSYSIYSKICKTKDGDYSKAGIDFLEKWINAVKNGFIRESDSVKKASSTSTNSISANNEEKLSKKAQDFLKNLRKKYGDYDFMIGNGSDEMQALSKSGSNEFSVIFSSDEIEKMANDEKYAEEKMQGVEGAVKMCKRICEENGYVSAFNGGKGENGTINKIGVTIDDNGNMKLFAELEKTSAKQKERIEKSRTKHAEEKRASERTKKKNPYEKEQKPSVKRTTIEASSEEEFVKKLKEFDWNKIKDSHSGDRFNFSV